MSRTLSLALAVTLLSVAPASAESKKVDRKLEFVSGDGNQRLRVGGQVQADALLFPGDGDDSNLDDIRLRRARLDFRSQIAGTYKLRMQLDFANSTLNIVDANLEFANLKELRLRIGKDKSPVSVDRGQSATHMHFLERGASNQVAPNRDLGIQILGQLADELIDYQVGVFAGAPDGAGSVEGNSDDRFDFVGRLTVQPIAGLEVGATWSYGLARGTTSSTALGTFRTSGRAAWFRYASGDDLANTAVADGERVRIGAHLLMHLGPVGIFGELISSSQELILADTRATMTHLGGVAQAVVVLTGEDARFNGLTPTRAIWDGGPGAVELSLRVHGIDVDDRAFGAGLADEERSARGYLAFTAGATWYLDHHLKVQVNYERSTFDGGATGGSDREAEDLLGLRVQHLF